MITLLGETNSGGTPTVGDLEDWADAYGIEHPVVSDANWQITSRYASGSIGLPSMHLLAPGAEVLRRNSWVTEQDIQDALP